MGVVIYVYIVNRFVVSLCCYDFILSRELRKVLRHSPGAPWPCTTHQAFRGRALPTRHSVTVHHSAFPADVLACDWRKWSLSPLRSNGCCTIWPTLFTAQSTHYLPLSQCTIYRSVNALFTAQSMHYLPLCQLTILLLIRSTLFSAMSTHYFITNSA